MEDSNGRTNEANMVSKPNHFKGKNNNKKNLSRNFMGPNKNQKQFKGEKGPCFVCGQSKHYARECRYRKDQKGATLNAIDEDIIVMYVLSKGRYGGMILVPLFMSPMKNLFSRPLKMQRVIKRFKWAMKGDPRCQARAPLKLF